ncbi:ParA family protein [Clostridium cellulovorans]|uniref:Sporulation initiation inhibitor protein Soj n=1 Tax=Clostridium cellulovorans (strain ATCC 35296 / DSM 3052 / OCM 3 / 743B) TaxID=573061 RepID=D9SPT5_CLOC7|nr:ParA family protein [Clostridium cellulovorans]ADL52071.1 sporulation initiation inhibitor soj family protein [Clostridium cellulovorans 743B]
MGKVISIVNQKGGVGKTTTTLNLGYALSQMGKKVLLIDFDPQSSLTVCFGYDNTDNIQTTIYNLMALAIEEKNLPSKEDYIISMGNLDLIPCNLELSAIEVALVNVMSREQVLRSIIDEIKDGYDYVIIDCSPSLGMLTINALAACDSVMIPVTPQYLSAKGLELLLRNIIRVKKRINPKISVDGILLTMYAERMKLSKEVLKIIQEAYGSHINIFRNKIPTSVRVGEANMKSKSTIEYDPKNKVSGAYVEFAKEVVEI